MVATYLKACPLNSGRSRQSSYFSFVQISHSSASTEDIVETDQADESGEGV